MSEIVRRPGVLNASLHDNLGVPSIVSLDPKRGWIGSRRDWFMGGKKWNKAQHMGGLSSYPEVIRRPSPSGCMYVVSIVAIEGSADCTKTCF